MANEIELKLNIHPEFVDKLINHPVVEQFADLKSNNNLQNRYFDSKDQVLTESKVALRIRTINDTHIQTLKTKGSNVAGLHQRKEWEWTLNDASLDLSLAPKGVLPETAGKMEELFETNFSRDLALLKDGQAEIELVVDQGKVIASGKQSDICEVELELKTGQLKDLFELVRKLAVDIPLVPSDVSKAERGYRLVNDSCVVNVALPNILAEQSCESAFCALMGYELERLQRLWEAFDHSSDWKFLQQFQLTLGNLRANIDFFSPMFVQQTRDYVEEQIHWLEKALSPILQWWPTCYALSKNVEMPPKDVGEQLQQLKAKQALSALEYLNQDCQFGLSLINLSEWLHLRLWREVAGKEQHEFSELPVGEGIKGPLRAQWQSLNMDRCGANASNWLDEHPKLQRLLTLCRYFEMLHGEEFEMVCERLTKLVEELDQLNAMEVTKQLDEWIGELKFDDRQIVNSWTRSETILMRDINQLASQLMLA